MNIRITIIPFLLLLCSCERVPQEVSESSQREDTYFVTRDEAAEIAQLYLDKSTVSLVGSDASITSLRNNRNEGALPSYYIFKGEKTGFVIVSANKAAYPVLGYSRDETLDINHLPCGLRMMLNGYQQDINVSRQMGHRPSAEVLELRAKMPVGDVVVAPIVNDIAWDQMPYYNDLCPEPNSVPVGCVATATAIIMRHWEYPSEVRGHHRYRSFNFGWLEHDFNYHLNWKAMPKAMLTKPNYEVARFCYGIAVALEMNFDYASNGGSGAFQFNVPEVLKRFYSYPSSVKNIERKDYTKAEWEKTIKDELDAGRPIQYAGTGQQGGHSFVCDGYDSKSYFHINWGWGGAGGWFKLSALDPDELGAGGGSGAFNHYQHAVINFAPPAYVLGDKHETKVEEAQESIPGVSDVKYPSINAITPEELYLCYTAFNRVETHSIARGYEAFFSKPIRAKQGEELEAVLKPVVSYSGILPCYMITVDFNRDGKFGYSKDDVECLLAEKAKDQDVYTHRIQLPKNIGKGSYRMRVIVSDNVFYNPNAKVILTGEVEDYVLTIE